MIRKGWVLVGVLFSGCWRDPTTSQRFNNSGPPTQKIGWVDTRNGSGGFWWASGHTSPAANAPWGAMRLGPDTAQFGKITSSSGYHFSDTEILGFSHTRLHGTGAYDGGTLRVKPLMGDFSFSQAQKKKIFFSHSEEVASPGFYSVRMRNIPLNVALTARRFSGVHRIEARQSGRLRLWINMASHLWGKGRLTGFKFEQVDSVNFRVGLSLRDAFSSRLENGQAHYFHLRLSAAPETVQIWSESEPTTPLSLAGRTWDESPETPFEGLWLEVDLGPVDAGAVRELFVGLSYLDFAGALNNLNAEIGASEFDAIKTLTENEWESLLGTVEIDSSSHERSQTFYTNLYRSFLMPTCVTEIDGRYLRFDGNSGNKGSDCFFTDFSLWDTYRTVHPLYQLVAKDKQKLVNDSLLEIAQYTQRLPRWTLGSEHVDSMMGFPSVMVLTESALKNSSDLDFQKTYEAIVSSMGAGAATAHGPEGRECLSEFQALGFCPTPQGHAVSHSLEYSYAANSAALFMRKLSDEIGVRAPGLNLAEVQERKDYFFNLSLGVLKLWDSSWRAFVPKDSAGVPIRDISLIDSDYLKIHESSHYVREGSLNQWRWIAAHLGEPLFELWETNNFVKDLKEFFEKAPSARGAVYPGSYFWQGNEPGLMTPFLFSLVGRPDLAGYWARWIQQNKYSDSATGLDGDDDAGTLSAYFVFSALGFYPMAGTDLYLIGSPAFEAARLNLGTGGSLQITAPGAQSGMNFVAAVYINGTKLDSPYFTHSQIASGGTLMFEMSATPVAWGETWKGLWQ